MKRILISAFIGSRNLGDEAIFKSITTNLDLSGYLVTAATVNEAKTAQTGYETVFVKDIRALTKAIRTSDLLLVGGGGIIQDQSSILNFLYYSFQLWYAQKHDVPVILMFVGVGPIRFRLSRYILSKLAPGVSYAVVRDESSARNLEAFGMSIDRIFRSHDPVLNYPLQSPRSHADNDARRYVVVSLRRWFFANPFLPVFITRNLNRLRPFRKKYDEYMGALSRDLCDFLDTNPDIDLRVVSLYDGEDDIVGADLIRRMSRGDRVSMVPLKMNEEAYLDVVRGAEFVVGMRLHSLILAATVEAPFVALRYSTKVDEFTNQMGLEAYSIHVERYDSKALRDGLNAMVRDRVGASRLVGGALRRYQDRNREAFESLSQRIKIELER